MFVTNLWQVIQINEILLIKMKKSHSIAVHNLYAHVKIFFTKL